MFTEYSDIAFDAVPDIPVNSPKRKSPVTTTKKKTETVRKFFPETWIWDIVPVG